MDDRLIWLCLAAAAAGVVNAVAGGGTLLTFPALILALGESAEASVVANATSTTALFPGSLASMWGYRREFRGTAHWIRWLLWPSILGGLLGSWLVVQLPAAWFKLLIPWLILTATLLFLLQPWIARRTGIGQRHEEPSPQVIWTIVAFQFLVGIYGGYFGAGIGILMLSSLALMGVGDIHKMNALKTLFASVMNGLAVAIFLWNGKVNWHYAIPMIVAASAGGFLGASVARRLDKNLVRRTVIGIGLVLSIHYFLRIYQIV